MTGDDEGRVQPLRSTDPSAVGDYRLLGRLGEGGMGSVYLGLHPSGRMVAVKLIRVDRAGNEEFRRRFRGEVKRARQVPPFCTAEVLDADPDHDPPYLVVEYVDGPSLTAVVEERGPLTPANLHGLAIGVATALTAIHGAGVIHRDLKPSNVLLPPGSPKVIDFGIARAVHGTDMATSTGQVIGTVAYMAPERFVAASDAALTPAADVFAWGAIVAYAGTARTPFGSDTPEITAVRIMTQEPDLEGLSGLLRDLVAQALAKDPAERPTARDLLDDLLGTGERRPRELAAAFARQPALLAAAEQAKAATDQHPLAETALAAAPAGADTTIAGETAIVPAPREPATEVVGPPAPPPPPYAALPTPYPGPPPYPAPPVDRWGRIATALLALILLIGVLAVVGFLTNVLPLQRSGGAQSAPTTGATSIAAAPVPAVTTPATPDPSEPAATPTGTADPSGPAATFTVLLRDPLTRPDQFLAKDESPSSGSCAFDGGLVVTSPNFNPYRCQGPRQPLADSRVDVDLRLLTADSCGAIWLRYSVSNGGYAVRICADRMQVLTHGVPGIATTTTLGQFRYAGARTVAVGEKARVRVELVGGDLRLYLDGDPVGRMALADTLGNAAPAPQRGRDSVGVFPFSGEGVKPFQVAFSDIVVYTAD
jgi:eukaryotic-like serine/threonine-protein kinase